MLYFIIVLSCAFAIFFATSAFVLVRRRQKAAQNVGYLINPNGAPAMTSTSTTQPAPHGMPYAHYQPQTCQPVIITSTTQSPNGYYPPPSYQYQYSAQNMSQPTPGWGMQPLGVQPAMTSQQANYPTMQPRVINEPVSNAEISVLSDGKERPVTHQTHEGAVETVSTL